MAQRVKKPGMEQPIKPVRAQTLYEHNGRFSASLVPRYRRCVDAWALGIETSAVLVGVWEDHGVGVDLEFDSSEDYT